MKYMKNSLFIVILLTFVIAGEAIGNALLDQHYDICLLDSGADGETETDSKENDSNQNLQIKTDYRIAVQHAYLKQDIFLHIDISQQASREVVTPPPERT